MTPTYLAKTNGALDRTLSKLGQSDPLSCEHELIPTNCEVEREFCYQVTWQTVANSETLPSSLRSV